MKVNDTVRVISGEEFFWCSRCHIALGKDWPLRVTFHDGTSYPRTELMSGRDFMNRFHG